MSIPFIRMAHERGLGIGDPRHIEVVGDDVAGENFGFQTRRSLVIWGDQMIRKGFLRPLERVLLHSPLMVWAPFASNIYHDMIWYPTVGRARIGDFMRTEWGTLFKKILMPTEHNAQGRRPALQPRPPRDRPPRSSTVARPSRRRSRDAAQGGDHVDVEQIMRDIRARIAQRHGIELTGQQIQELAARRLEADPRPAHDESGADRAAPARRRRRRRRSRRRRRITDTPSKTRRCTTRIAVCCGSSAGCSIRS